MIHRLARENYCNPGASSTQDHGISSNPGDLPEWTILSYRGTVYPSVRMVFLASLNNVPKCPLVKKALPQTK